MSINVMMSGRDNFGCSTGLYLQNQWFEYLSILIFRMNMAFFKGRLGKKPISGQRYLGMGQVVV
jgi:hypothetical protein